MRYLRQEMFPKVGKKRQKKLGRSSVTIIGLGALGTVSADLLARAGIGKLILIDRDIVELSNLQRQSLFDESDVGRPKAFSAAEKLKKINSEIEIEFISDDLNFENIGKLIQTNTDLVLDCTDNLETRFLINDYCVKNKIPFIYSAGVGSKGYVFGIVPKNNTPCLRCFLNNAMGSETCETTGVLNSLTHIIASMQSNEAIKILIGKDFEKSLLFFDLWKNDLTKIKIIKNKNCICCSKKNFEYLNGKKDSNAVKMCGSEIYQIKSKEISKKQFSEIKSRLGKIERVIDFGNCISFDGKITLFSDGRALVKAKDEKEAKSLYSRFVGN